MNNVPCCYYFQNCYFGVLYWIDNNKAGKPYNFEYHE